MNVARLLTRTFTLTKVDDTGARDEFGDATEHATAGGTFKCYVAQTVRAEQTVNADTQEETWTLYLEPAANGQVDGTSRGVVDGVTYELTGPPWPAANARTAAIEFVKATVRKVA